MANLMTVAATRDDGRVALWEKHPDHPDGEVYVADGTGGCEVARTPAVLRALAEGRLIEVTLASQHRAADAAPPAEAAPAKRKPARGGPESEA